MQKFSFEPASQFWTEVEKPQLILDSISKADTIELGNYTDWNHMQLFTSDSLIQESYFLYDDSLKFSISVTEILDNKYSIKYVHE